MTGLLAALVIATQVFSGGVLWAWVKQGTTMTWTEFLGMGAALGMISSLGFAQILRATPLAPGGWLVPALLAVALVSLHVRGKVGLAQLQESSRTAWWAWGPAVLVGLLYLVPSIARTPLVNGYVSGDRYHGDLVFLEAVGQSIAAFGPLDSLLLAGEPIRYHWLAYGWAGQTTQIIGAEPFVILTRVLPVLLVLTAAWLAASWASRLSDVRWVPGLASLLVVAGGYIGAQQGVLLTYDSPSTGYATVLLLAFSLAFSDYLRRRAGWPLLPVLLLLTIGTVGAKASHGAVLAAGVGVVALVGVFAGKSRQWRPQALRAALVTAAGVVGAYVIFLAGIAGDETQVRVGGTMQHASTFQGLDPGPGTLAIVLGTTALVLAAAPRWVGVGWLLADRQTRWDPETWFGVGLIAAAVGTLYVLSAGTNAAWFALAATAPVTVLSAVGLGAGWRRLSGNPTGRQARTIGVLVTLGAIGVTAIVFANFGLAQISGAPILWRGPFLAWGSAALLGLLFSLAIRQRTRATWVFLGASVLTVASLFARTSGPAMWEIGEPVLQPVLREAVRLTDPSAELVPLSYPLAPSARASGGRVPTSQSTVAGRSEDASSPDTLQWSATLNDAAARLKSLANPDDIVATDSPLLQPFPAVMTNLRMLLAGRPYVDGYTTTSGAAQIRARQQLMDDFLAEPNRMLLEELRAYGVRWLWLQQNPQEAQMKIGDLARPVWVSEPVVVLEVPTEQEF